MDNKIPLNKNNNFNYDTLNQNILEWNEVRQNQICSRIFRK
jgi:hypothetical protein